MIRGVLEEYERSQSRDIRFMHDLGVQVHGDHAKARYTQEGTGQFAARPVLVDLKKTERGWVVLSEKWNKPRWWDMVGSTVGIK